MVDVNSYLFNSKANLKIMSVISDQSLERTQLNPNRRISTVTRRL